MARNRPPGRVAWWWLAGLVAALALGTIFGRWAFAPPTAEVQAAVPATVAVADVTVGNSVPVPVSAHWHVLPFGVGAAEGTLTSLDIADGDTVEAGQVLYSVNLRPVVAAVGEVPAFRDLRQGDVGADVEQVQQFLANAGYYHGPVNGHFGPATTTAVNSWLRDLNLARDGMMRASDIVFTPQLPARVTLAENIAVGRRIAAGDSVLAVLSAEPEFRALAQGQQNIDRTQPVIVTFDGENVEAVIATAREQVNLGTLLILTRPDGTPICADLCDLVPLDAQEAIYPARQVITPEISGPGVPAAAVWFTAAGEPYLVDVDGTQIPVTITGQGQGQVVLDGVAPGTVVVLVDDMTRTQQ